ncbi:SgcJ/EcaC family oxidoreductase [Catellatospora coxensis]
MLGPADHGGTREPPRPHRRPRRDRAVAGFARACLGQRRRRRVRPRLHRRRQLRDLRRHRVPGRADIIESHRALFRAFTKGTRLAGETISTTFLGPDTAVVVGRGDTYKGDRRPAPSKIQTYTLVREPDGWRVAAFHNTRRRSLMEAMQFRFAPGTRPAVR